MLSYKMIVEAVKKLKFHYKEDDPIKLCEAMGIKLLRSCLGTGDNAIKGFFLEHRRIKTITVNDDLPEILQRVIIAHEIGHSVLHRKNGIYAFHDVGLFNQSGRLEQEANLFAAELMLEDREVFELLNEDHTFFSIAAELSVPVELLDFKYRTMKWKGYKMVEPPISAQSDFLANVEIPQASGECNW